MITVILQGQKDEGQQKGSIISNSRYGLDSRKIHLAGVSFCCKVRAMAVCFIGLEG